jgi:hypothetical protein
MRLLGAIMDGVVFENGYEAPRPGRISIVIFVSLGTGVILNCISIWSPDVMVD